MILGDEACAQIWVPGFGPAEPKCPVFGQLKDIRSESANTIAYLAWLKYVTYSYMDALGVLCMVQNRFALCSMGVVLVDGSISILTTAA